MPSLIQKLAKMRHPFAKMDLKQQEFNYEVEYFIGENNSVVILNRFMIIHGDNAKIFRKHNGLFSNGILLSTYFSINWKKLKLGRKNCDMKTL